MRVSEWVIDIPSDHHRVPAALSSVLHRYQASHQAPVLIAKTYTHVRVKIRICQMRIGPDTVGHLSLLLCMLNVCICTDCVTSMYVYV